MNNRNHVSSLRRSMTLLTVAGCLAMIYITTTTSPVFTEFLRAIGATELHFGLLGGISMVMLSMQFAGAVITNYVRTRKTLFMILIVVGRMLYIPVALLPLIFPSWSRNTVVGVIILIIAVNAGLINMAGPLWLSWMADLIPRRILNRYWGRRQRWMYFTWAASFLAIAVFVYLVRIPITVVFPILCVVAVIAGVVDILLFVWIKEPPNTVMRDTPVLQSLLAPFQHTRYRSFVVFSCAWSASGMFVAAFMHLYVLKVLGLNVWQTTLIWCMSGIGVAVLSAQWGRLADKHGHRPVIAICIAMKSIIVIVFLTVTSRSALWVLPITLFVDSFWTAGMLVASNGYMLKIAPQKNRSMFIAAITGLAGICGGLGAMAGGGFLHILDDFSIHTMGRTWINYHVLFLVNILMRWGCIVLAFRIQEPESITPEQLLYQLRGIWPMRFLLFPIGLYRKAGVQWFGRKRPRTHQ